jgi:hypothetical protein
MHFDGFIITGTDTIVCSTCLPILGSSDESIPAHFRFNDPIHCFRCLCPIKHKRTVDGTNRVLELIKLDLRRGRSYRLSISRFPKGSYYEGKTNYQFMLDQIEYLDLNTLTESELRTVNLFHVFTGE